MNKLLVLTAICALILTSSIALEFKDCGKYFRNLFYLKFLQFSCLTILQIKNNVLSERNRQRQTERKSKKKRKTVTKNISFSENKILRQKCALSNMIFHIFLFTVHAFNVQCHLPQIYCIS